MFWAAFTARSLSMSSLLFQKMWNEYHFPFRCRSSQLPAASLSSFPPFPPAYG